MNTITDVISFVNSDLQRHHRINIPVYIVCVTFETWLDNELAARNWTRNELARRGKFSHGALANVYSGTRKPGVDLCTRIAQALGLPPELVFEKAGILPRGKEDVPDTKELDYLYLNMTHSKRMEYLAIGRIILGINDENDQGNVKTSG